MNVLIGRSIGWQGYLVLLQIIEMDTPYTLAYTSMQDITGLHSLGIREHNSFLDCRSITTTTITAFFMSTWCGSSFAFSLKEFENNAEI